MARSRTPAAVPRPASRPQEHLCDPYGWWGMPNLVGRCTLPQVVQGHYRHRYPSHTAAFGMRSRPRGALLVLPADPSRQYRCPPDISTIDPDDVSGRRAQLLHAIRPRRYHGDVRTLHSRRLADSARFSAQRLRAGSAGPQRPCLGPVDTLGPRLSSLRRSTAGGALCVRHGVTPRPVNLCPAAPDDVLGWHPPGPRRAATDKLAALRIAAY